jgi:hypothetical protein
MTSGTYVIPFKSRGRLFVEIPEHVERDGRIVAGEPLQLELVGKDIVYHRIEAKIENGRRTLWRGSPTGAETQQGARQS